MSSGPSIGIQLAERHTKKVANRMNLNICLIQRISCSIDKSFSTMALPAAGRAKDLAFPKILFAVRTVVAPFISTTQRQKHVLQRGKTEADPKQRGEEEKQSNRAKVSTMKGTNEHRIGYEPAPRTPLVTVIPSFWQNGQITNIDLRCTHARSVLAIPHEFCSGHPRILLLETKSVSIGLRSPTNTLAERKTTHPSSWRGPRA